MCDECHVGRVNNTSATTQAGTLHAYTTHPTQQLLVDTARANLKPDASIAANLRIGLGAAPELLARRPPDAPGTTGNIDCQTCHAVHGPTWAPPASTTCSRSTTPRAPTARPSARAATTAATPASRSARWPRTSSPRCRPASTPTTRSTTSATRRSTRRASRSRPPGTNLSTPNSDRGAQPLFHAAGAPACSSCHDTHGGLDATPLLRGPQPVAGFGAMNYNDWCFACHTYARSSRTTTTPWSATCATSCARLRRLPRRRRHDRHGRAQRLLVLRAPALRDQLRLLRGLPHRRQPDGLRPRRAQGRPDLHRGHAARHARRDPRRGHRCTTPRTRRTRPS